MANLNLHGLQSNEKINVRIISGGKLMKKQVSLSSRQTDPRTGGFGKPEPDQRGDQSLGPSDAGNSDVSLQLIVESAIRVAPGSSAVIYTYDQETGQFEKESRVSAVPERREAPSSSIPPDDAPRPNGIGMRTLSADVEVYLMRKPISQSIRIRPRWA